MAELKTTTVMAGETLGSIAGSNLCSQIARFSQHEITKRPQFMNVDANRSQPSKKSGHMNESLI